MREKDTLSGSGDQYIQLNTLNVEIHKDVELVLFLKLHRVKIKFVLTDTYAFVYV